MPRTLSVSAILPVFVKRPPLISSWLLSKVLPETSNLSEIVTPLVSKCPVISVFCKVVVPNTLSVSAILPVFVNNPPLISTWLLSKVLAETSNLSVIVTPLASKWPLISVFCKVVIPNTLSVSAILPVFVNNPPLISTLLLSKVSEETSNLSEIVTPLASKCPNISVFCRVVVPSTLSVYQQYYLYLQIIHH